jgi:SAM-dependent methyltransferase
MANLDQPPAYAVLARYYDLQHGAHTPDIPMYLDAAAAARDGDAETARVLELGCGTGRVLIPLAAAGHYVLGIDASPEMLGIARLRLRETPGARCDLVLADATQPDWPGAPSGACDLAIIALNTFLHNLTRESQLGMLAVARSRLRPGGALIVDLPPNDELVYQPDSGEFELEARFTDPDTGAVIEKYAASTIEWSTQEQRLSYRMEERAADGRLAAAFTSFRLRHVFKHEMELLLLASGYASWRWHGDYDLSPYAEGSPRMIVYATA